MNFPLRTAFAVFYKFWDVVSSFLFVYRNFLICSLISFLTHSLFSSMLFNLHEFECFWVFSLRLVLVSVPHGQRKFLIRFRFSWICWDFFCVISCGVSLKMMHVHLKRMFIFLLWDESVYIHQLSPFVPGHWSILQQLCWYFVWKIYPFLTVGCWNLLLQLCCCQHVFFVESPKIFFMDLGAPILGAYIFIMFMSSWWILPLSIMKWPSGSLFMALL